MNAMHKIPLKNHDQPFVVSLEDAMIRTQPNWCMQGDGYVIRYEYSTQTQRSKTIFAHRIIAAKMLDRPLKPWPSEVISHINKNLLDCSRPNLRIGTLGEAVTARKTNKTNTASIYRGVSLNKNTNKWVAHIKVNGSQTHLGTYSSEADAALAYDTAAEKEFGDLAQLNFPE
jgi:hypothetical protein